MRFFSSNACTHIQLMISQSNSLSHVLLSQDLEEYSEIWTALQPIPVIYQVFSQEVMRPFVRMTQVTQGSQVLCVTHCSPVCHLHLSFRYRILMIVSGCNPSNIGRQLPQRSSNALIPSKYVYTQGGDAHSVTVYLDGKHHPLLQAYGARQPVCPRKMTVRKYCSYVC